MATADESLPLQSMDRTSGLGLTYTRDHDLFWADILAQNKWFSFYLPLLAQAEFVANAAAVDDRAGSCYASYIWPRALPYDWSTVSALRTWLSVTPPEDVGDKVTALMGRRGVKVYIGVSSTQISFYHRKLF